MQAVVASSKIATARQELDQGRCRMMTTSLVARKDERARWAAVVSLAPKKRLFSQCAPEAPIGVTFGKKFCDINERLNPF
jgi:hypothetical protein